MQFPGSQTLWGARLFALINNQAPVFDGLYYTSQTTYHLIASACTIAYRQRVIGHLKILLNYIHATIGVARSFDWERGNRRFRQTLLSSVA